MLADSATSEGLARAVSYSTAKRVIQLPLIGLQGVCMRKTCRGVVL